MRRAAFRLGITLVATLAGCSISRWSDYESDATVIAFKATSPFPSQTFGTILGSYVTTSTEGDPLSRLVVGSGRVDLRLNAVDGMYAVYSGWNDDHLALGSKIYAHCQGSAFVSCAPDAGTTLAVIPDILDRHGCVISGAPDVPMSGMAQVTVSCESSDSMGATPLLSAESAAAPTSRFGTAVAGLPATTRMLGAAVVTAPVANELWVMDYSAVFKAIPVVGATTSATSMLGTAMATASITSQDAAFLSRMPAGDERALVALTATGDNRVYITVARVGAGIAPEATVVACLDGPAGTGFGTALAAGDLDGDGIPEVFLGASATFADRANSVGVFSLADADLSGGTPIGCGDPSSADDPLVRTLGCTDSDTASCEGFGAAMALGDATGDGRPDLLVGAPFALVGTTSHAGAAYLFRGDAVLDVFVAAANAPAILTDSSPKVNDTLGFAVTFLASQLREANAATDPRATPRAEPVASAPGANRIFLFLCSGFADDSITEDPPRCIIER